jgi:S-adenosylmethionine synthetase
VTVRTFTSESVTEGHPDKVADRVSDAVLDAYLEQDPMSRVACETLVAGNRMIIAGEVTSDGEVDSAAIARDVIASIGYDRRELGFDAASCEIEVHLGVQSSDIAMGVSEAEEVRGGGPGDEFDRQGAGDQGMMFGYATAETAELMPLPIHLAHRMAERLSAVRKSGLLTYLRPDGKTQVTFEYDAAGRAIRLDTVVMSTQHDPEVDRDIQLRPELIEHVIRPSLPPEFADDDFRTFINPTGRFVIGGPAGDAGLTGRKIIVDTYGGMARHGGGAFSGKDATKVDRSGAYATRWVAKNVVASGAATKCEVQVAYAIGVARPVSVFVETFGTESVDPAKLGAAINEIFDLRPAAIIEHLQLRRPIYTATAAYGHFGRSGPTFTWEQTDRIEELRIALQL